MWREGGEGREKGRREAMRKGKGEGSWNRAADWLRPAVLMGALNFDVLEPKSVICRPTLKHYGPKTSTKWANHPMPPTFKHTAA